MYSMLNRTLDARINVWWPKLSLFHLEFQGKLEMQCLLSENCNLYELFRLHRVERLDDRTGSFVRLP